MKFILYIFTTICFIGLFACSNGGDAPKESKIANPSNAGTSAQSPVEIQLPIEVIGADGYTEEVQFKLADGNGVDRLYLQCHRCGYRDTTTNKERGAKGSVRLNGGVWVDLDNKTASVMRPDQDFGGIGGGFHTVRFTVPITGAQTGVNKLEFRFHKTDGFTNGYRILAFNLQRGGQNVLPETIFNMDDPSKWTAQLNTAADIQKGKELWSSSNLRESPLTAKPLKASCASCHTADGRDLKYFNYSNWSIVERSKFHQLTELEGKQIASYIRTLTTPSPTQARPWNPPYQPGPGLDAKPVQEWAAGAGLKAVLASDQDMLPYLFPMGTNQAAINAASNIKGTLNARELPVSIQLPDWNAWLPEVHPLDVWGDAFANSDAPKKYQTVRQKFDADVDKLIKDKSVVSDIESLLIQTWKTTFPYMYGPVPCLVYEEAKKNRTVTPSLMDQLPQGLTCEDGLQAVNHWLAVKNWELFHTFNLEDDAQALYPYGEKRSWLGKERNVFEVASHRSADNSHNFKHQSRSLGSYQSNSWYHLQMVLNAGNRDPYTWFPQDWFYTPLFIALNSRDNRHPLALMQTAMQIKMYQNLDRTGTDGKGTDTRATDYGGWWLPFVQVWRFESSLGWEDSSRWTGSISADGRTSKGFPWTQLDTYESGLRIKVTNAFLREFLNKQKSYPISSLRRRSATDTDSAFWEASDYVVSTEIPSAADSCFYSCPGGGDQAAMTYRALYRFREMGVDRALRNELIDYMQALFPSPQNNWNALR